MAVEVTLAICNKKGLHARPAAKLVKMASGFTDTTIHVTKINRPQGEETVNVLLTSVLGLLMLAAEHGSQLTLRADGPEAAEALAAIAALVEAKFEEVE